MIAVLNCKRDTGFEPDEPIVDEGASASEVIEVDFWGKSRNRTDAMNDNQSSSNKASAALAVVQAASSHADPVAYEATVDNNMWLRDALIDLAVYADHAKLHATYEQLCATIETLLAEIQTSREE